MVNWKLSDIILLKSDMKVAITGATGFLGKYLVNYLKNLAYNVLVVARAEENANICFLNEVAVYKTDYTVESLVNGLKGADVVIHLVAQTMQRDTNPFRVSDFFPVNVGVIENVLIASYQAEVKAVYHMSSNSVYSLMNKLPFREEESPVPSTIYGVSKLYAEKLGEYISSKIPLKVVSLRLARLFGYGERDSVVFTKYMKLAVDKKCLEVWGEGKTSIEYLYVRDVVAAIEMAVRSDIPGGSYNVGCNCSYSVLEVAETINRVTGNVNNLILDRTKQEGNYHILMDSSKFCNATGWKSAWHLEDAIRDMFKSYQDDRK